MNSQTKPNPYRKILALAAVILIAVGLPALIRAGTGCNLYVLNNPGGTVEHVENCPNGGCTTTFYSRLESCQGPGQLHQYCEMLGSEGQACYEMGTITVYPGSCCQNVYPPYARRCCKGANYSYNGPGNCPIACQSGSDASRCP
jgi:hypothetical protein